MRRLRFPHPDSIASYTRVTVGNGGVDSNSLLAVSGGVNPTFNSPAVSDSRTLSGTPVSAGVLTGNVVLTTSGEGLSGEAPIPVTVNYTAPGLFRQRTLERRQRALPGA